MLSSLGDTVTTPPGGSTFWNPHMAAVLSGGVISNQGATVEEPRYRVSISPDELAHDYLWAEG